MSQLRVYRIPFSTNVDRVAIAAAFKGLDVEWIDVDPDDRTPVREVSGQELVPVAVDPTDGTVVADSPRILEWIEERWPSPSLWPADPGVAALADVFCRRFNEIWKGPPNRLTALLAPVDLDRDRLNERDRQAVDDDVARMRIWLDRFEERLDRPYLGDDAFGICDVTAYPFLRYGCQPLPPGDDHVFHRVLVDYNAFDAASHPRLTAWCARVDERFPDVTWPG